MAHTCACHAQAGCVPRRPQLARRTTVLCRWREAPRRCGGLVWGTGRLQSARHRACASQARVLRLLPIDSESSGALACVPRESRLYLVGRSWHVAARSCAEGERCVVGAVASHWPWSDHNPRSTPRARGKLEFRSDLQLANLPKVRCPPLVSRHSAISFLTRNN